MISGGSSTTMRVVVYEGDGSRPLEEASRYELFKGLLEKGYSVTSARTTGCMKAR